MRGAGGAIGFGAVIVVVALGAQVVPLDTLLPLVVGRTRPEVVAAVLEEVWGGPETLVVISTDLSHFNDYDTARTMDRQTSDFIESLG